VRQDEIIEDGSSGNQTAPPLAGDAAKASRLEDDEQKDPSPKEPAAAARHGDDPQRDCTKMAELL
jgi:hypothetical protein